MLCLLLWRWASTNARTAIYMAKKEEKRKGKLLTAAALVEWTKRINRGSRHLNYVLVALLGGMGEHGSLCLMCLFLE